MAMKINKKILLSLIVLVAQSCDCHYKNTQAYVKCLEDHKGNEDYCIKIKSKYPSNTCKTINYNSMEQAADIAGNQSLKQQKK
jgi:hypothetical protein